MDFPIGIGIRKLREEFFHFQPDAEFFPALADNAVAHALFAFALSAGKFPEMGAVSAVTAATDQNFS